MDAESRIDDDKSSRPPNRLWLVLLALCLVALGAAALVLLNRDDDEVPADAALQIGWAVPDGEQSAGSVVLEIDPAAASKNDLIVDVDPAEGSWLRDVEAVTIDLLPYRGSGESDQFSLGLNNEKQRGSKEIDFSGSDAWEVRLSSAGTRLATYFVLLPDPNVHGDNSIALLPDDPQAAELFARASRNVAEWHRVRYEQQLSDGAGLAVVSFRDVNDGSDGSTPGFRYYTPNGLEAYVIGTTAWTRYPGEEWEVRESHALVPPSEWGGEYEGATGFQFGPMSEASEGPCRVITFLVPGNERQAIAWYAWCIDEETGTLFRDSMIARAHYMITEFSDFDGEVTIMPPPDAPPPASGSPSPVAAHL